MRATPTDGERGSPSLRPPRGWTFHPVTVGVERCFRRPLAGRKPSAVPGEPVISIEGRLIARRRAERVAHNERAYSLRVLAERRRARRNRTLLRAVDPGRA